MISKIAHRRKTQLIGNRYWRRHRLKDWKGGVKK